LLVDEIGPLELNGNGFHLSLVPIFKNRNEKMLFVVRAGLVDKVCAYYNLTAVQIIGKSQLSELF
jgi:nucleoside-triphosphatase THEP1